MNLTNEERIARLNKIIQKAQEQRQELVAETEVDSVDQWERELEIQVEETEKAAKSKGGAGF